MIDIIIGVFEFVIGIIADIIMWAFNHATMVIFFLLFGPLIVAVVGGIFSIIFPSHNHFCDTCYHSSWHHGQCYCTKCDKNINDIRAEKGCIYWKSNR